MASALGSEEQFAGEPAHPMYTLSSHQLPRNPEDASALLRSYIPQLANPITAQLSYGKQAIPNLVLLPLK